MSEINTDTVVDDTVAQQVAPVVEVAPVVDTEAKAKAKAKAKAPKGSPVNLYAPYAGRFTSPQKDSDNAWGVKPGSGRKTDERGQTRMRSVLAALYHLSNGKVDAEKWYSREQYGPIAELGCHPFGRDDGWRNTMYCLCAPPKDDHEETGALCAGDPGSMRIGLTQRGADYIRRCPEIVALSKELSAKFAKLGK